MSYTYSSILDFSFTRSKWSRIGGFFMPKLCGMAQ